MSFLYYLFGNISSDISDVKAIKKFHYLENELLCGDAISSIIKSEKGIIVNLQRTSKEYCVEPLFTSMTWNIISLVDTKLDGYFIFKNHISKNRHMYRLIEKWKQIVCFKENTAYGISSLGDLFYIELTNNTKLTIERLPNKVKVDSVSCGSDHTLILCSGRVLSKGLGSRGQLGHGDLENSTVFLEIAKLGCIVSKIACGFWHSVALTEAGDVYSWGWNESGQLGVPCWSEKESLVSYFKDGDLLEEPSTLHMEPIMVTFPSEDGDWTIVKIDCGSRHTVCLNEDGRVYAFGWGQMGQLGREDGQSYDYPVLVEDFTGTDIRCTQWGTLVQVRANPGAITGDTY